ncbi:hypothetical protein J4H86_12545 [Spiractinospora alimapuensis]|uniref:hypothetical protein n=1 Tax=Spiractinospora alimapuensis TaxID=2820884 RepID=UPI001F3422BA|nr:hypothetical protein [Spiractinospora alimapuensis]QVQ54422.1 hypothetical protein J4H86_12545 [Spiractinospora alimapuensis]
MADLSGAAVRTGPGRVLIAIYAVFALGATTRAVYQIATRFEVAPLAYALSALAAAVYVVATVGLARGGPWARRVAAICCSVELVGVVVVGAASYVVPAYFPDATVWSHFGSGYFFVPLVLPIIGLWWLWRGARDYDASHGRADSEPADRA